ncbi:MAG: hypothetical protein Q9O62_11335 [Ardenticatenia bacterium]|nr:hypothetical protein [Ardenticatenia bacterium]
MDIRAYQEWFEEYDRLRGWDCVEPCHVLAHLIEEIGEIARHVLRLDGYRELDEVQRQAEIEHLAMEINDAFVFLTKLAICYNLDLADILRRGQAKAEARTNVEEGRREMARYLEARRRRLQELVGIDCGPDSGS